MYINLGIFHSLQRDSLSLLNHRLQFTPSYEHFIEQSNEWVLGLKKLEFSHNTLILG
jgi:hypothetical protein